MEKDRQNNEFDEKNMTNKEISEVEQQRTSVATLQAAKRNKGPPWRIDIK